ncbi:hotdog fold thioesterase [Candidatus Binatia bacterium]|nr:hotdog fold thioesterase [Candidatus Binatia bacterium]
MDVATLEKHLAGLFPGLLGIRFREAAPERVRASLVVRDELCTTPGILHGGAIMAFADTLGAVGTVLNLKPGESTTTIESKTNFLSAGKAGTTIEGECTLLHRGRRTMVWQTRITSPEGRAIAVVTQTQAVLEAAPKAEDPIAALGALFARKPLDEQQRLLATLEHAGAATYRTIAAKIGDPAVRAELEQAALREEENARVLERLLAR